MKKITTVAFLLFIGFSLAAQYEVEEENTDIFLGGVSPFILDQGQIEVNNQSFLVSYRNVVNTAGRTGAIGSNVFRYSIFQNTASVFYGFSDTKKWDMGFDLGYTRTRWDDAARESPLNVFNGDPLNFSGFSTIGAKVRFAPLESMPGLVLQSGLRFPIANGNEQRRGLNAERLQFNVTGSFYQPINYDNSYFLTLGWTMQPAKTNSELGYFLPTAHNIVGGAYLTMNLYDRSLFFIPGLSYSGLFQHSVKSSSILQRSHAVLLDFVFQYQFSSTVSANLQTSFPLLFESHIPNVAFERASYSVLALSFRVVI